MRHQDTTIRTRAWAFGFLALIAVAFLVQAYVNGRATLPWWLIAIGAVFGASRYYRRSRK